VLCKKFDEVFDQCMDIIRGLGGSIDLGYLQHGDYWSDISSALSLLISCCAMHLLRSCSCKCIRHEYMPLFVSHRLGQQLKVYWPEEHIRVEGIIDDHDQIDSNSHIYHIFYQDGNEQVRARMPMCSFG
jgi:hypothetical protein